MFAGCFQSNRFIARLKKHNIIPVIVVPWTGKDDIEIAFGKDHRKLNFAEYVIMQGGMILFTGEFERYLKEKLGKKANFIKMFRQWWTQKKTEKIEDAHEEEFTELILNHLFEQGSKIEEQPVPIRCT